MKVTVNKYLNARVGNPSTASPCPFYHEPGDLLEIDDVVIGDEIDGNSVWYRCKDDGCYYWSGGITEVEFDINKPLDQNIKSSILNDLIKNNISYFKTRYKNVTGVYLGNKTMHGEEINDSFLVFQVSHKTDKIEELARIPKQIFYKGILIRTDVIEASVAEFEWIYPGFDEPRKPGGNISRFNENNAGTISFKAESISAPTKYYIVTNYHVVGADLIREGIRSLDVTFPSKYEIMLPAFVSSQSRSHIMGSFVKGLFNVFQDSALIQLTDKDSIRNKLSDGTIISGPLDIFNKEEFKGRIITMHGAKSGIISNKGKITSVNAAKSFSLRGSNVTNSMIELLQFTKISQPGDSGSPILLGDKIIGILVGSDSTNSYAIAIQIILDFYKIKICNT